MKRLTLVLIALVLSSCGVDKVINPTYSVMVENPEKALMSCTFTVDGETKQFETDQEKPGKTGNKANEWMFVLCQKKNPGTQKLKAIFYRNDSPQETSECSEEFCIVAASGMTK